MNFIKGLNDINNAIKLVKFEGLSLKVNPPNNLEKLDSSSTRMRICFLDLETTGINKKEDEIIEIALKCIELTKTNGNDMVVIDAFQSFQDPGIPIPDKATQINGITDDMVKGHHINWDKVEEIINKSQLLIAHNAQFDRAFLDRAIEISKNKIWACSINDIDWVARNFKNKKQELLCIWHGFYYDAHRAMIDVDALIYLLTHPSYIKNKPITELIHNAKKPMCKVLATHAPFEYKDLLKNNEYRWDANHRVWYKFIQHQQMDNERAWLVEKIYNNNFQGKILEITPMDKYKDN